MEDYSMEQPVEAKVFFVCADGTICTTREDAQDWDAD